MQRSRQVVPPFIMLVVLICSMLPLGCATTGGSVSSAYPPAPDVSYVDIDGKPGSIADFVGEKVVVVNFWGIRCQNCIEEMPFLERLHHKYGNHGLVILGVNTDGVDGTTLKRFLPQVPATMTYPLLVDPEFALVDAFELMGAPLTVVIARDGTVRYRHEGYEPEIEGEYVELIEKLLKE